LPEILMLSAKIIVGNKKNDKLKRLLIKLMSPFFQVLLSPALSQRKSS